LLGKKPDISNLVESGHFYFGGTETLIWLDATYKLCYLACSYLAVIHNNIFGRGGYV